MLANWVRDWSATYQPTILGGGFDASEKWQPAIAELERVGRRAASGAPRLSRKTISNLVHFFGLVPNAPIGRVRIGTAIDVEKIKRALNEANKGRLPYRYSAAEWATAAARTKRLDNADGARLYRRQRKNYRDALAWEQWSNDIAKLGQTVLTSTVPSPRNTVPVPRRKLSRKSPK